MQSCDFFGMILSPPLVLADTLWVYQLQEKSENILHNYVHSQESIYQKLASEGYILAQKL